MSTTEPERISAIDTLLQASARGDAPGYIVGIAQHGRLLVRRASGLASVEQAVANTPKTRMRIGSVSKQFTGLAMMLLVEDGKLDIDQAVRTYLPELSGPNGAPTLRQCLNHSSGLRDALDGAAYFLTEGLFPQIPAGLSHRWSSRFSDAHFAPGEAWNYSNYGYLLLSLVIEKVSGLTLGDFMQQRLFAPLGMVDSQLFPDDMELLQGLANSHIRMPDGRYRRGIYPSAELLGAGGIVSTVDDMLRWAANLREPKLGSAASWAEMLRPPRFNNGSEHNYGFGIKCQLHRGVELRWHDGSTFGSKSALLSYPQQGLDIVVMANRSDAEPGAIGIRIAETLLADVLAPAKLNVDAAGREALIGHWYSRESRRVFSISPHQGKLMFAINASPEGLLRVEDDGAIGNDSSAGPLRLLSAVEDTATQIDVQLCGQRETYARLPETAPPLDELAAQLVGHYYLQDFATPVRIVFERGELHIDLDSRYQPCRIRLTPVSDEVLLCSLRFFGAPLQGTLSLQRRDGAVSGFYFSLQRSWNLYFARSEAR
ncbi:serine hydrolase domain-containing protein [Hydrocarboniphaga sp.]|uniref:serine hydrolase domain-containing protein n=1 Tax=Hydrocarboniphaga sp. TaxID=2033016 RepID=UPI003D110096